MRTGGCRCGAIRYGVDGPIRDVLVCHCGACRAAAGGPWAATASKRADLALVEADGLRWHLAPVSEHGASRGSCGRCGTVVFWDAPGRATVSIGVDTLDDSAGLQVAAHIWVEEAEGREPEGVPPSFPQGLPAEVEVTWHCDEP